MGEGKDSTGASCLGDKTVEMLGILAKKTRKSL